MNIANNYFSQEISIFGYRINLGQAFATATALTAVTIYALKKIWKPSPANKQQSLSNERFWQQIEEVPTIAKEEGPIVIQGKTIFPTLAQGKLTVFLNSTTQSEYVKTYFFQSTFKGILLDLGCGIGANSIPLWQRGWKVIAIDNQPEVIATYTENCQKVALYSLISGIAPNPTQPTTIKEDIITSEYHKNVDAVICVDVLPYIPPAHLKATLDKIFQALRPGGKFIGTLFFRSTSEENPLIELMGKLGAHFYPGKELTREIVTRSGFQIKNERERNDGSTLASCIEFLAEKPS